MTLRPDVQFRSRFPDDTVQDDHGIAVWPGRNIAEAVKGALERLDYRVSEPISVEHAGWELDIRRRRESLCLRINIVDADECYLMTKNSSSWLWPETKLFRMFLTDLQGILEADSRFSVIGWFPKGSSALTMEPAEAPFDP